MSIDVEDTMLYLGKEVIFMLGTIVSIIGYAAVDVLVAVIKSKKGKVLL